MTVLKKAIQALANLMTTKPHVKDMLIERRVQLRLAEMYNKLEGEIELRNEILFFMHHCLICDLTSREMMPCTQVICESFIRVSLLDPSDPMQVYVLKRTLMALESVTRKNALLLSDLASNF